MRTMYFDNIPAHCPFQLLQDSPPGLPSNFMFSYFIIIIFLYNPWSQRKTILKEKTKKEVLQFQGQGTRRGMTDQRS